MLPGNQDAPYLAIEGVPLRAVFRLLARRAGLNYLEPQESQVPEEEVALQITEPKPKELLEFLLKHRGLELYDAGTGLYTIRKYRQPGRILQIQAERQLHRPVQRRCSERAHGRRRQQLRGRLRRGQRCFGQRGLHHRGERREIRRNRVAAGEGCQCGRRKNNFVLDPEKQQVLLCGTRPAAERLAKYLEIANTKNPNIRIDVRIFATTSNPMSRMGVDWANMLSPGLTFGLLPPGTSASGGTNSFAAMNTLKQLGSAFGNPMSSVVLRNDISATVNFFVNDQKGETVAQPSTITANGREAAFAATQQIPYISGSSVAGG